VKPAEAGHRNLLEFGRHDARWQSSYEVVDESGVLLVAGASDFAAFNNGVFRTDDARDASEVVSRARAFFGARGRGFSLWARLVPEDGDLVRAAEAHGLGRLFDYPQMICRRPVTGRALPAGVELRWVVDGLGMADFAAVCGEAYATYGTPEEVTASHFGRVDRFTEPHVQSVVAYHDGAPVAAAQILSTHGIAGVYWVATVPAARGRGLAEVCTAAVTNRGFELGAANVQLQASSMGEPIYRRMGYEELYRYAFYLAGPPEAHPPAAD
jgi:ribosomal protein S18 acetylase RimI-like enzyme